jgi:hypothetical protein
MLGENSSNPKAPIARRAGKTERLRQCFVIQKSVVQARKGREIGDRNLGGTRNRLTLMTADDERLFFQRHIILTPALIIRRRDPIENP